VDGAGSNNGKFFKTSREVVPKVVSTPLQIKIQKQCI
jgi:hypothetical protein